MNVSNKGTCALICSALVFGLYACKPATTTCPTDTPTIGLEEAIERRDRCAVLYWTDKEKNSPIVYFVHGITPRMLAAKTGNIPILEAVLNTNWSNTDKDDRGLTPLHWAVLYNHKEAANLLLNAGYEIGAEIL